MTKDDNPSPLRVTMAVTNDIVTDQRVHRSCMTLLQQGWQVSLIGRWLPESIPLQRPYTTHRMRLVFRKKAVFYAEYNIRLFLRLLFARADLFYANDMDTLPAVFTAARLRHKSVFFDAHEMFPEVPELVGRPRVKYFWERVEAHYLPRLRNYKYGAASSTVCRSIAEHYHKKFGLEMSVVRNVPMPVLSNGSDSSQQDESSVVLNFAKGRKVLLYQGAVNVGRGLEWLVDAMPLLPDCVLVIIGTGDVINNIRLRVQQRHVENQVLLTGRLSPAELRHITPHATLGTALLANMGLNYYYAFPNRIADFVLAGVPVLASDFPEMHRIVDTFAIGTLVPDGETSPQQLTSHIRKALDYWSGIPAAERQRRFDAARRDLSWDNDSQELLAAVRKAIN